MAKRHRPLRLSFKKSSMISQQHLDVCPASCESGRRPLSRCAIASSAHVPRDSLSRQTHASAHACLYKIDIAVPSQALCLIRSAVPLRRVRRDALLQTAHVPLLDKSAFNLHARGSARDDRERLSPGFASPRGIGTIGERALGHCPS